MAALGVALVGAAAGGVFGGVTGALIGYSLGSIVGSLLFPPDLGSVEGPRLQDLQIQSSAEGAPIADVYGTARVAGNVIWGKPLEEHRHEEETGGKGGGGVAGMEAAYIATLRGHKVTLFEKESELGGIIRTCCRVPVKKKWKWYIDWIREQLAALNVDVRLNTEATFDNLDNYDAVLCGTGTKLIKPNILGIDKAISYEDVLRCTQRNCQYFTERPAPAKLGHTVVVWGNHYQASDTAEMIAMKGREVIVVTEDKEFCPDIETIHREVMMMRFSGGNGQCLEGKPISIPVKVKTRTTVSEIGDEYVVLMDDKFNKETIKVDNVVLSKVESNTDLYDQLLAAGKKVAKMGDARIVKNVHNAVRDGANLAFIIDDDIFMNSNNMLTAGLPVDVALSMNR